MRKNLFPTFCIKGASQPLVFALFVLSLANIPSASHSQNKTPGRFPEPVFEHLTIADGLPDITVRCILQDHLGYMWFGTQDGLARYDGYDMKVYQADPDDSLSISNRNIITIYEDKSGTLWIGTYGGLNRFDRNSETFTRFVHNPENSTSINSNRINILDEDKAANLWVGTDNGLNVFNRQTKTFRHISYQDSVYSTGVTAVIQDQLTGNVYVGSGNKILVYDIDKRALTEKTAMNELTSTMGEIHSFYRAADGTIWIAHSRGIARFNPSLNTIKCYQPVPSLSATHENDIFRLIEDKSGFIWCGGAWNDYYNLGVVCFDPETERFRSYKNDPDNQGSLSANFVWSVYEDHSGVLWFGTGWAGLNKWDRMKPRSRRYIYDPHDPDKKHFGRTRKIIEDQNGINWFGTGRGLYSLDRSSGTFRNFKYDRRNENNTVYYTYTDEPGIIWFGTPKKGLCKFDVVHGSFHFYANDPNDSTSISNNNVVFILPDKNDVLWIGTFQNTTEFDQPGINRFDRKTGIFSRFLSGHDILCIYNDRRGQLWIGTDELELFNRADESFRSFKIKNSTITTIYEDDKGNFWLGVFGNGLYLFDRDKGIPVYSISEKDGLPNNDVNSILEDNSGKLWLGTSNGLARFDPETRTLRNYFTSDVFDQNRYQRNSASRMSSGEMLFGTYDGLIAFNPDSIKDDPVPPQVVIRNVSLFNRAGEQLRFDGFISELKELDLSYIENDLRFDYVGLHFGEPKKNRYKYKLENFDRDWVDAGTQRNATYTNLDPGEYTFRVNACNKDGVWNEQGASIKIVIAPPWWKTIWAYLGYGFVIIGVLYSIRQSEKNRDRLKHQAELEHTRAESLQEVDSLKSRFFANISHEFRTPLTLILGPSENVLNKTEDEETRKQVGSIQRNASRLLNLVNQLLDLSKLEAGKLTLKASRGDIVSFVKGLTMSFESAAESTDTSLKVEAPSNIDLYFDREKMTKVMTNLLSNAFKFTPEGGKITVTIEDHDETVAIKVRDSGIGIPKEELPKLFDRFYQVDSSQTREHEGTGIGLALTKELVELHHGTISADSSVGEWTEVTVVLRKGREHLKDDEVTGAPGTEEQQIVVVERYEEASPEPRAKSTDNDRTVILIVEDNAEVRAYIRDSIGQGYRIEEAANGELGVKKAETLIPDLIISDVMMPKMDGNELTRRLKNDEKTSHIPIILLTAKSEQESKLEGLETGADDYLTKPFDSKELLVRVKNLIDLRRKLRERFSIGQVLKPGDIAVTSLDDAFLKKAMSVVEKQMSNEDYGVADFAKEMSMGRTQLHRKLTALTNQSAGDFIRYMRLQRAKDLLLQNAGNVSEIAFRVGFNSVAYFTKCFHEQFGIVPSEFRHNKE